MEPDTCFIISPRGGWAAEEKKNRNSIHGRIKKIKRLARTWPSEADGRV